MGEGRVGVRGVMVGEGDILFESNSISIQQYRNFFDNDSKLLLRGIGPFLVLFDITFLQKTYWISLSVNFVQTEKPYSYTIHESSNISFS